VTAAASTEPGQQDSWVEGFGHQVIQTLQLRAAASKGWPSKTAHIINVPAKNAPADRAAPADGRARTGIFSSIGNRQQAKKAPARPLPGLS
jgi:hypothetical protein